VDARVGHRTERKLLRSFFAQYHSVGEYVVEAITRVIACCADFRGELLRHDTNQSSASCGSA
jgi:hypothetical protein